MAKQIRTDHLKSDPGSKFLEYARGAHHFAISLQQISVFDEQLYFWSLTWLKQVKIWLKVDGNLSIYDEMLWKSMIVDPKIWFWGEEDDFRC